MDIFKIDREMAREIAEDAMENAGFNITEYSGFWTIWRDREEDIDYAVAINKEQDDDGNDQHFGIYVSINRGDEDWWEYTDEMDVEELTDELLRIAQCIEINEMEQRGASRYVEL